MTTFHGVQQEFCQVCEHRDWQKLYANYDFMYAKRQSLYDLYQCQHCGLIVLDSDRRPETLKTYYPAESYYAYQKSDTFLEIKKWLYILMFSPLPFLLAQFRDILGYPLLQMMRGIQVRPQAKVLDIGCGSGKFLAIIRALHMQPFGVEVSEVAVNVAKNITPEVYLGEYENLEDSPFSSNPSLKFDVIVANHVLEHTANPIKFLQKVNKMLTAEGLAIIATPNYQSVWAILFGRYWAQLDTPRHLFVFSPGNMEMLCQRSHLRIKKLRHLSSEFGIMSSLIYLIEDKFQVPPNFKIRKLLIILARIILLPVYTLVNLLRIGDTVEYHLEQRK